MSLREWLILIGALLILGIVLDGLRRMHRARRDSLEISRGMGGGEIDNTPIDDDFNPELPNGGARIAARDGEPARDEVVEKPRPATSVSRHEPAVASEEPPLVAERDDDIPVEGWSETDPDISPAGPVGAEPPSSTPEETVPEPSTDNVKPTPAAPVAESRQDDRPPAGANRPEAEEVVVINVHAKPDQPFSGKALKQLFEACGLEHGDLGIYHRHEQDDTRSPVQFSVANAVEPGHFDPATMDRMSTPGISFFMSLPGPTDSMKAFEFMLETAQAVVRNLDGDLKDERRSVMTGQTIEHCRQRIREYERKRRSVRA